MKIFTAGDVTPERLLRAIEARGFPVSREPVPPELRGRLTLFGIPVVSDETLPPGTIELRTPAGAGFETVHRAFVDKVEGLLGTADEDDE